MAARRRMGGFEAGEEELKTMFFREVDVVSVADVVEGVKL